MTDQTAVGILSEMTLAAAVEIVISQGLYKRGDSDFAKQLSEALKTTVKAELDRVMAEWKEALEANPGNAWLQQLMKTQAVELAQQAIKSISM